jgi:hypothetical protein
MHATPCRVAARWRCVPDNAWRRITIGKGTGLGLSQVYGITRQAGGTARVMSEEGQRTTVQLWQMLRDQVASDSELMPEVEQRARLAALPARCSLFGRAGELA